MTRTGQGVAIVTALRTPWTFSTARSVEQKGTTPGGDEVRGWSEAVGVPLLDSDQEGVMGNAARRISVHGLALEKGVPYFVSARATNGVGLTSNVGSDSRGVVFDPTPPTTPGEGSPLADLGTPPETSSSMGYAGQMVASPPAYLGPMPTNMQPEEPQFTVRWTAASDDESGIKEYEYVVSREADAEGAFEEFPPPPPGAMYFGPITRSGTKGL